METIIKVELPLKRLPTRKLVAHYCSGIGEFGGSRTNRKHTIAILGWCVLTVHRNEYHDRSDKERADEYLRKWSECETELRGLRMLLMGDSMSQEVKKLIRDSFGVDFDEGITR